MAPPLSEKPLCVHVLPETSGAGAENQALTLLRQLRESAQLDLELVCFAEGDAHERFRMLGIPIQLVPRRRRYAIDFPFRVRQIRRLYGRRAPSIMHSWLFEGNTLALAAARPWLTTRTVIAQRSGTFERQMRGHMAVMRRLYPRADHALANSRDGAELLFDIGLQPDAVTVVPQGIAEERVAVTTPAAQLRDELCLPARAPVIVSVGRPDATKDYPTLVAAYAAVKRRIPAAILLAVGPTIRELCALADATTAGIRALGWQEHPADFLNLADVVVISSWTEGNSNVAGEALLLGASVVTTDTGDHRAVVLESGGRVTPIRRPDLLGDAICELILNPLDRAEVRAVAERALSPEYGATATLDIYEQLLRRPLRG